MLDSLIKNYSLLSKIGEGTFSEVLKVQNKNNGRLFAAKRLTRPFMNMDEVNDYIELKTLLKLDRHENVLTMEAYIYETDTKMLTLVFNLMDQSLYDYIKDMSRKMSETRCQNFLFQLASGLCFLHKNGIFHRDIKPENILVRADEALKLSHPQKAFLIQLGDLGSVTCISFPQPHSEYVSTRWYRAPECLLTNGYYGAKMDVWALGCCFFEMLSLQPLFPGENEIDQLDKIHKILGSPSPQILKRIKNLNEFPEFIKRNAVDFYKMLPNLSNDGLTVLKKMLSYNPDTRINATRLYEHNYFDSLRRSLGKTPSCVRRSISESTSNVSSTKSSSMSLNQQTKTNLSSSSQVSYEFSGQKKKKVVAETLQQKGNKILERNWNMPSCASKKSIISSIKSVQKSQKTLHHHK